MISGVDCTLNGNCPLENLLSSSSVCGYLFYSVLARNDSPNPQPPLGSDTYDQHLVQGERSRRTRDYNWQVATSTTSCGPFGFAIFVHWATQAADTGAGVTKKPPLMRAAVTLAGGSLKVRVVVAACTEFGHSLRKEKRHRSIRRRGA